MSKPIKQKSVGRDATYDDAFKLAVVSEYLKGELGFRKLAAKYGLPGGSSVEAFVNWYKKHYPNTALDTTLSQQSQQQAALKPQATNSAREAALQKELEDARLKIAALETMIAIADKELGTSILKKSGAKQSKL